ncbi:RICIN domain-containing protein [Lentzea sp. HUAS12]|nr:RICIN domain-containing protein [Lentzea sp. HUAS12]USX56604.1 RICIN domain-containing protein [Lentzea sp. HUAS12]
MAEQRQQQHLPRRSRQRGERRRRRLRRRPGGDGRRGTWRRHRDGRENVTVVGTQSGRRLDVATTTNNSAVRLWDCDGGANQRWNHTSARQFTIGGRCLDASGGGTANGTAMIL